MLNSNLKSVAESPSMVFNIEEGFQLILISHDKDQAVHWQKQVLPECIQFHFCMTGNAKFTFNARGYNMALGAEKALLLYNPDKELPIDLLIEPKTKILTLLISIEKFHALFTNEAHYIPFLSPENLNKKYYSEHPIAPALYIIINQIFKLDPNNTAQNLFYKAKAYELLSLYFSKTEETDTQRCPFLVDEDNVQKIRKAKDLVISNMTDPPGLEELADAVGLSLKKLKTGFKQVYGDSVFNFLLDYKLQYARKLLDTQDFMIHEVGQQVGYSSPSHFIEAFRKKFGITPKKYVQGKTEFFK